MKPKGVPRVSKGKKRRSYPFPKPAPGDWPQPWEPADLHWAKFALEFGNTAVLARYLREAKGVDPSLLKSLRRLLGPDAAAEQGPRLELRWRKRGRPVGARPSLLCLGPAELADFLDPPSASHGWELKFIWPKGSPGKPNKYWRDQGLYTTFRFARIKHRKVDLAVEYGVKPETQLSRSTIYRALEANKPPLKG